jgi:catechol 2,3-dioxygenase-like lactoylglutathione lyase family enzyme
VARPRACVNGRSSVLAFAAWTGGNRGTSMIRGMHGLLYTSEPEALRAFLRDKLGLPASDVGDGWLIFDVPEADLGCHPDIASDGRRSGTHSLSFYCDDVAKTRAELAARGVEFIDEIRDQGYGLATHFRVPGGFAIELYQPSYAKRRS